MPTAASTLGPSRPPPPAAAPDAPGLLGALLLGRRFASFRGQAAWGVEAEHATRTRPSRVRPKPHRPLEELRHLFTFFRQTASVGGSFSWFEALEGAPAPPSWRTDPG